jgi:hypothetical protein
MSILKNGVLLTKRGFLLGAVVFSYFFTFYFVFSFYVIWHVVPNADIRLIVQSSFNAVIAIALVTTGFFFQKINKLRTIYACALSSTLATVSLIFASPDILKLMLIFLVGIFLGIGQIAFSTYFWDLTVSEERGRAGGFIGFVALPFYFINVALAGTLDLTGTVMLGSILSLGIVMVMELRPRKAALTAKKIEKGFIPEKRTILLYSIPWVAFSVINATLAWNVSANTTHIVSSSFYFFLNFLQFVGTIVGALSGGIIADLFGRRISLAFSLTLYGISSALVGLFNNDALFSFAYLANGLSWGMLLTLYIFVVYGDLANERNCGKMYSIGLAVFYLSMGITFFAPILQIPSAVSSLASCLLIFLSNLPIILAPELLPADFREKMSLALHMRAVRKIEKQS